MKRDDNTLLVSGLLAGGLGAIAWLTSRTSEAATTRSTASTTSRPLLPDNVSNKNSTQPAPARTFGSGSYWSQMGSKATEKDIETLGRVIISETGSQSMAEWQAIAWVARNKALVRKTPLHNFLCDPCGKQGKRMTNGKRRTFSTRQKFSGASLRAAREILNAPQSADPTQGATSAFEPKLQDKLFASGRYRRNAKMLRAEWGRGGGIRIGQIGRWELWAQKRRVRRRKSAK